MWPDPMVEQPSWNFLGPSTASNLHPVELQSSWHGHLQSPREQQKGLEDATHQGWSPGVASTSPGPGWSDENWVS